MGSIKAMKLYDVNSDTRIKTLFIETNLGSKKLRIPRALNLYIKSEF